MTEERDENGFCHESCFLRSTFAESLMHANRVLLKEFGVRTRRVPAHAPFVIDKVYMEKLQSMFAEEYEKTSAS